MEEIREQPKRGKAIVIAVIAVVVIAAICFLSQWEKLTYLGELCQYCSSREPTKGNYCDICYEKLQNIFETAFTTTP